MTKLDCCIAHPPIEGSTDFGESHTSTISSEIRAGHDVGAQLVLTDTGLVAKIYDPMFYPFGDEDLRGMKNDISTNADSEYSIEAAAYSELQGTSVEGSATPRYHGSWTMDIIQDEQDERITRQVRLIFTEQISGVRTADIDLFELTPDVKEAIMINVIEADYHVRRAGVRHHDIAPETSFCLTYLRLHAQHSA